MMVLIFSLYFVVCFQMFRGNSDRNSIVSYTLLRPFKAQYVRIHPKAWRSHISMRAELYGCQKGIKNCQLICNKNIHDDFFSKTFVILTEYSPSQNLQGSVAIPLVSKVVVSKITKLLPRPCGTSTMHHTLEGLSACAGVDTWAAGQLDTIIIASGSRLICDESSS